MTQKDILEVSDDVAADPGANQFPYMQDLSGLGLQEVIPLEPAGFGAFALRELLFIDATTGKARVYRVPDNPRVNGPRKSDQNIRKADPNADWGERRTVEPRLVVRRGKIYWLPSLILDEPTPAGPKAAAYIMSVLVDAVSLKGYLLVDGSDLTRLLDSLQASKSPEVTNAEAAPKRGQQRWRQPPPG
ncbi:MAG: hypothetical protein LC647_11555 [Beggiatoa sp.]|nr:hypothetical protein [Beggiatoa sp.]